MHSNPVLTFSRCAEMVASFIAGASQSLSIAVCWFTHPELGSLLLQKIGGGLEVQLVVNFDQINFRQGGLDFRALENAGAKIFGFPGPVLMHHKFAIADGRRVLNGSFNWTGSDHFDHVIIWDSPQMAIEFTDAFDDLVLQSKPLSLLMNKPVRNISFQQVHQPTLWSAQDLRKAIIAGGKVWIAPFNVREMPVWRQCYAGQLHYYRANPCMEKYWQRQPLWEKDAFCGWLLAQEEQKNLQATARYCLKMRPGDILIAVEPKRHLLALGLVSSDPEASILPGYCVSRYVPWIKWPEQAVVPDPAILKPGRALRRYSGSGLQVVETLNATTLRPNPAF